jgi:hypothetical protein
MKPTLSLLAAAAFSFATSSAQVTISVSSEVHALNGASFGYNNNEAFSPDWTSPAVQQVMADTYTNLLRYPGGTTANYFNWETGGGYAPTNKAAWRIGASVNTYDDPDDGPVVTLGAESGASPSTYSTGTNTAGNTLPEFLSGIQAISAIRASRGLPPIEPVYVMNLGTSANYVVPDITHQLDALEVMDAAGYFPEFVEMGNELFIDNAFPDYTDMFPTAESYADRVKSTVLAIRNRFPGKSFKWGIPVVKNITPVGNTTGDRSSAWARKVLTRLAQSPNPLLPHALIFHYYTTNSSDTNPATAYGALFNAYSATNWLNYFPLPDTTHLNGTTDIEGDGRTEQNIKLWITEYGMAGQSSNPAGDQWFYALHLAGMGLLQLESPRFEISTAHVVFAGSSWSHLQTTAPYSKQNLGWGSYILHRATAGKAEGRELSFSPNPTNGSGSTAYPTLYGWEFSKTGGSEREQLIINFSASTQTISTTGLGTSGYEQLVRPWNSIISGTDADFVSAGGQTFGTVGTTISLPAYSITRLYGPTAPQPTVTVNATDSAASEPADTGTFTFTRTGSTAAALTVNYSASGTATSGSDYTSLGTSVTIPVGSTSATRTVTPIDDAAIEGSETVLATLAVGSGYTIGSPSAATVTITDNDVALPTVAVTTTDNAAAEPAATGTFTFTRTGSTAAALTVNYAVSGTATSGSDYTSLGTSVTIPAGSASATRTVTPVDDVTAESAETVILSLSANAAYSIGSPSGDTVTITDNDTPVTVTLVSQSANDGYVTESTETSNTGGSNAAAGTGSAALRVGDTATDQQVKTILSFDTSSIPDGATITAVTIRLQQGSVNGTSPFGTHGQCRVDIKSGAFGAVTLENSDFEAAADSANVATLSAPAANGDWASGTLSGAALALINKTGTTQFRVYFQTDDNDDSGRDDVGFFPGEAAAGTRPELIVRYTP